MCFVLLLHADANLCETDPRCYGDGIGASIGGLEGGPGPPHPEIWSEGSWIEVCVTVKYPTLNLFCLVFVLYDGYS